MLSRTEELPKFNTMLSKSVFQSQESYVQKGVVLKQEPVSGGKISRRNDTSGLCHVCGDRASGRHYGVASCEGCKSFFKRSIRCDVRYSCRFNYQACPINVKTRSRCQFCRLQKCFRVGMRKEAVKQPDISNPPPPLLMSHPAPTPFKIPTLQLPYPPYTISLIRRDNWLARCRQPFKYIPQVELPMKNEQITTRILRYIVVWAKSLPLFKDLCFNDKHSMLEACWLELFLLVVTQYQLLPDLAKLLMLLKGRNVDKTMRQVEVEVNRCKALNCDEIEMECLKVIVLYNSDCQGLTEEPLLRRLQEEILVSLDDHIRSKYPNISIGHLGHILLYLPRLRLVKLLVPQEFIFPELTKKPDFVSTFIKEILHSQSSFRSYPNIFNYSA